MIRSAEFSPCRAWRYLLVREWAPGGPTLAVIGLNPSTADETQDDPTIRRIIGFASRWGFGGIRMLNLFAFRATDPKDMKRQADPVGVRNDEVLLRETSGSDVLCCWGAHGAYRYRDDEVLRLLRDRSLFHLGLTKHGHPRHPLYLRSDSKRIAWEVVL